MKKLGLILFTALLSSTAFGAPAEIIKLIADSTELRAVIGKDILKIEETMKARCPGCFILSVTGDEGSAQVKTDLDWSTKTFSLTITPDEDSSSPKAPDVEGDIPADIVAAIVASAEIKAEIGENIVAITSLGQQRCLGCFKINVKAQVRDLTGVIRSVDIMTRYGREEKTVEIRILK